MSNLLEGKKTFIGVGLVILGLFGGGHLVNEGEVNIAWDAVVQLVGIVLAIYGRVVAKPK